MTHRVKLGGERGSVLMETILVIPLYIAFFSGIFLLGDLELGRNRLTAGDRFAVWLVGNRHEQKDDSAAKSAANSAFFPQSEFADGTALESFSSQKNDVGFYAVVRGGSALKIVMPVWAVQTRKGVIRMLADVGTAPDEERWDNISLRPREIDSPWSHSVLMRTKYDIRDRDGRTLAQGAPIWHSEFQTAYIASNGAPTDRPSAMNAASVSEYTRLPQFDSWSR